MVTSSYPLFPGDVTAPFIEEIARGMAGAGHDVDVILPHHPRLRRDGSEPVRFFPYRYAPFDSWSLWGYAQSLESDVRVRRGMFLLAPLVALALRRELSVAAHQPSATTSCTPTGWCRTRSWCRTSCGPTTCPWW